MIYASGSLSHQYCRRPHISLTFHHKRPQTPLAIVLASDGAGIVIQYRYHVFFGGLPITETHYKIEGFPIAAALLTDTHGADPEPLLKVPALACASAHRSGRRFFHGLKPRPGIRIEGSQNVIALLTSCAGLVTTFVSLGKHEAYLSLEDIELIHSTGVTLLDNRYVIRDIEGKRLIIGGLSSGYFTA